MRDRDWKDCFRSRSLDGCLLHPNAPAGGPGGGSARPPGTSGLCWPTRATPHPDSPAGRHCDWHAVLTVHDGTISTGLAKEIVDLERHLARQSETLGDEVPDRFLRSTYLRFVQRRLEPPIGYGERHASTNLVGSLRNFQTALRWFDSQPVDAAVHTPVLTFALTKASSLDDPGVPPQKKREHLRDLRSLIDRTCDEARAEIQGQWREAARTGRQDALIRKWTMKSRQSVDRFRPTGIEHANAVEASTPSTFKEVPPQETLHWIAVKLAALPDAAPRKPWWPPLRTITYAQERFEADITSGPTKSTLDSSGSVRYDGIPGGACSWSFPKFFDDVEAALKPPPGAR